MTIRGCLCNSLVLALISGSSFSSHGATADIDLPEALCVPFLTSATRVSSAAESEGAFSESARQFLALLDVGVSNLGPEIPVLLRSLRQLVESHQTINPFLNLKSPLALALAGRTEPLLADLSSDWPVVRSLVGRRIQTAIEDQSQRVQDEFDTRSVATTEKVPFPTDVTGLYYIGETRNSLIFGLPAGAKQGIHRIYRLSKQSKTFRMIFHVQVPTKPYAQTQWMHNGAIFGFGIQEVAIGHSRSRQPGIFRLNPETEEVEWAEPWIRAKLNASTHRLVHRINASNSVVGIEAKDPYRAIGEVYLFDHDQLMFVKTGLFFDETSLLGVRHLSEPTLEECLRNSRCVNHAMQIGRHLRSDGHTIVTSSDSKQWSRWSPGEMVKFSAGLDPDSSFKTSLENMSGDHVFELLDDAKSILGVFWSGSDPPVLLSNEGETWTAKTVELDTYNPSAWGKWSLVRNQTGDLLAKYESSGDVALWKFSQTQSKFELLFHESLAGSFRYSHALIDFEKLRFVAWAYFDHGLHYSLQVRLPVDFSR